MRVLQSAYKESPTCVANSLPAMGAQCFNELTDKVLVVGLQTPFQQWELNATSSHEHCPEVANSLPAMGGLKGE